MNSDSKTKISVGHRFVTIVVGIASTVPAIGMHVSDINTVSKNVTDTVGKNLQEFEVVSARVRKEVSSTAPMFNLTNEQMKTIGVTDLTDALHRLPGLNIRDYGGAGGLKTVSVRGFGANHTGVIYDGVVLSDCQSGKIDLSRYSLDNVGSLSVIVGDNSDIFVPAKASASAASIVISTLSVPGPEDKDWHLTAQFRTGSWWLLNPYFNLSKTLSRKFSFSVIGEYTHGKNNYPFTLTNGKLVTRERRNNSMMNSGHGEVNLRFRPTGASTLDAKLYYYDNDRQLPGAVILYNPVNHETLRDRNFLGQLTYKNLSLSKFAFQGLAKFNWDSSKYQDVDGKYPGGKLNDDFYQREVYVSGSALYMPTDRLSFNYSADYFYNNLSSNESEDIQVHPRRHSILQSLTGKFKNSWFQATARVLWSVYKNSVKHGESARDENKVSPSASMSVQPFRNTLLFVRASYKNIFRMPTFNDNYYYHMGSVSLKPEDSDQLNLGLTYQTPSTPWLSTAVVTADVYYNHVKNKIVAIPQNMFYWSMMNVGKVRAIGVDLTLNATFNIRSNQHIVVAGNYSYQRVQPRTNKLDDDYNKQLAYTPKHSGAASVTWQNPWVDVIFHTTGAGERFGLNSNMPITRIDGYIDCGAGLMHNFKFRNHSLDLRVDIMNIFDKQYEIVADYPMPGRSWRATLTFKL